MAQFAIEIADADIMRVMEAIGANYKRQDMIDNPDFDEELPESEEVNPRLIENPETLFQFANRIVRQFLSENVKAHEVRVAKEAAASAASAAANIEISDPAV